MSGTGACRVLMVYPRFHAETFWNFTDACELLGARHPAPPLGLITVAALLPAAWEVRLVNRNTDELTAADLDWADLVMTGGMLPQQPDALAVIALAQAQGKPVVVGGPDATSSPHIYAAADFQVLGEAEGIIGAFITAWEAGERAGVFTAEKFKVDVSRTPAPRFDLLRFDHYLYVGVQFSRGCPFTCEFCDIIELYGRVPRTKTTPQMLAELEALYRLGYRGYVDFVDDNLIGNKKALKAFLPHLAAWQEAHDHPFEFATEASVNLADDDELLRMMREANFFGIFVGIESPDPATLKAARKKQNTRRDLVAGIHKIYAAGMYVTAGFIVGFDTEEVSIADAMVDFIEDAAIPVCMVGLLFALPNTQLTRRLEREGRLHADNGAVVSTMGGDQCTSGLNFETKRPLRDILDDYRRIIAAIYDPAAFAGRLDRLAQLLDRPPMRKLHEGDIRRAVGATDTVARIVGAVPEAREAFWRTFLACAKNNPAALRYVLMLMTLYIHLGPFSRQVIAEIDRRIAALDAAATPVHRAAPQPTAAE